MEDNKSDIGWGSQIRSYVLEWQLWRIDSLLALNRHKEALKVYEETASLYFNEFGLKPSEKMLERFHSMSSQIQGVPSDMWEIRRDLREKTKGKGAYFCSLPSFIDTYRIITRMTERTGMSVFLIAWRWRVYCAASLMVPAPEFAGAGHYLAGAH